MNEYVSFLRSKKLQGKPLSLKESINFEIAMEKKTLKKSPIKGAKTVNRPKIYLTKTKGKKTTKVPVLLDTIQESI
jgi:hypothetical protein